MKKIWIHTVRGYIKLGLFFYFNKIKVFNSDKVPDNSPVLFLANHQNALLDALLIATTNKRLSFFLTRASVFNNPIISKILKSLNMIPVYRIRDGWNNLTNNNAVFNSCTELLNQGESIAIFPEGNHNLKRMVRPLSKGFTRIVFDALEKYPDLNLKLIPVGLNYEKPVLSGDSVSIFYGNLIDANSFISGNKNEGVIKLKQSIFNELTKLTTHIPSDNYIELLKKLENLNIDFLEPEPANYCIESNFKNCIPVSKKVLKLQFIIKPLLIILLIVPYLIWKFVIEPKIKEPEFISTFRFALVITLVPMYVLIVMCIVANMYNFPYAVLYLFSVLSLQIGFVKS